MGWRNPAQGVIATMPATAPEEPPSAVGYPSVAHSKPIHPSSPADAASWVSMNACTVTELAARADPASKPNQQHPQPDEQGERREFHPVDRATADGRR